MAIDDIIPRLDDKSLATMRNNVARLEAVAGPQQRRAAELLPLVEAEMAERAARVPPKPEKKARVKAVKPAAP